MTVTMNQLNQILAFTAKTKAAGINLPIFIWGEGGVGKTSAIYKFAKDHNFHMEILHLANQSPEVLLGLEHKDTENLRTVMLPPEWLARGIASERPTIYFLDEINRCPKYVLQGMFAFINEGHLHSHTIKPNDIIIVAGNPDSNDYEVTAFEDKAFLSRFCHVYLEPTVSEVEAFFRSEEVNSVILEAIKESPEIVSTNCPTKIKPIPTNRMLHRVGLILNLMEETQLNDFGYPLISGMIGPDLAGIIIKKAREAVRLLNPAEILDKGMVKKIDATKMDIVTVTSSRLAKEISNRIKTGKLTKKNKENIGLFMAHIPQDAAVAFIEELRKNGFDDFKVLFDILCHCDSKVLDSILNMKLS